MAIKKLLLVSTVVLLHTLPSYAQSVDLCYKYLNSGNYAKAINIGERIVKNNPNNANAYLCLGIAYRLAKQIDLSIKNLKKAVVYAKRERDLMYIYNQLGVSYYTKGDLENAAFYSSLSLDLANELKDTRQIARILNNIGDVFYNKGELDKALMYYKVSIEIPTGEIDKEDAYKGIALVYSAKGNYEEAVRYFKKAMEIAEKYGAKNRSVAYIYDIGNMYLKVKDYENAKQYFEEGLKKSQSIGNRNLEGRGYTYLGLYYKETDDWKSAKDYLSKAYQIFMSMGDSRKANSVAIAIFELEKRDILGEFNKIEVKDRLFEELMKRF